MRTLLAANNFMTVSHDGPDVTVCIDCVRIATDAKYAIEELATRIHFIVMTADKKSDEPFFTDLTAVEEEWLEIRDIAVRKAMEEPSRIHLQANAVLEEDGSVTLVEYDATVEGVIKSWMERDV